MPKDCWILRFSFSTFYLINLFKQYPANFQKLSKLKQKVYSNQLMSQEKSKPLTAEIESTQELTQLENQEIASQHGVHVLQTQADDYKKRADPFYNEYLLILEKGQKEALAVYD